MSKKLNEQKNGELGSKYLKRKDSNTTISECDQILTSSNIDLSEIEATEENLQNYTLSKQFLKIDLNRIRELIIILEEYFQTCINKGDINLAKIAKQRIILFKRIEKEKMMMEAKVIYSNQLELVQDKMKEELDNYMFNSNQEYEVLSQGLENQQQEMIKTHQEELEKFKKNFDENYRRQKPRPSKDFLNWEKIKEYALKQNKFNKVQEALKKANKYKEKDDVRFKDNKEKKLNIELKKIKHRQENEKNAFIMKKNNIIEEFNKNKDNDIDKIKKKYEAKLKELKNYQKFEISNFNKIARGIIKPCSRIQNIISSATNKDNDTEDKNKKDDKKDETRKEENEEEHGQKEHRNYEQKESSNNVNEENEIKEFLN